MTPKEKAEYLREKMSDQTYTFQEYAGANMSTEIVGYEAGKKCAMAAVDEILNNDGFTKFDDNLTEYWQEVKQELEKL